MSSFVINRKTAPCSRVEALEQRLACLADAGPEAINERLAELDSEWTSGRMTKTTTAVVILAALVVRDILQPKADLVRAAGNDDPAGGVLNGAEDVVTLRRKASAAPRSVLSRETAPQNVTYRTPNRPFRVIRREVAAGLPWYLEFSGIPSLRGPW